MKMKVVIAANHNFLPFVKYSVQQCAKFDYETIIYDLGNLGFGIPFQINNEKFQKEGYYNTVAGEWKSRALHKPLILLDSLSKGDSFVYLDADAIILNELNLEGEQYDIAVTLRKEEERNSILGKLNAGVIFYRNNQQTKQFLEQWREETEFLGNDQRALNKLVDVNKETDIKYLPTTIYNYYYFPRMPGPEVKIAHFKSNKNQAIREVFYSKYANQIKLI